MTQRPRDYFARSVSMPSAHWSTHSLSSGSSMAAVHSGHMLSIDGEDIPRQRAHSDDMLLRRVSTGSIGQALDGSALFLSKAHCFTKAFEPKPEGEQEPEVSRTALMMWVLFGASGWWSGNIVFAELPLFVVWLPAREKLGNQLALMTQLGNVFLIAYKILEIRYGIDVGNVIHAMMAMGLASLIGCALFWDAPDIEGKSVALLSLMILAGGVGCLSNATYWALMIWFPRVCTKAVGLGMSLGGVFSATLAALQLSGRPADAPRVGASAFFVLAAGIQGLWWIVACIQLRQADEKRNGTIEGEWRVASEDLLEPLMGDRCVTRQRCVNLEIRALNLCSFLVHAATYTLPTVLPYVASAYPSSGFEQQMLLWMLVLQQLGEASGRIAAPTKARGLLPLTALLFLIVVFSSFLACGCHPPMLAALVPYAVARAVLPLMSFLFYFSYGVMQTVIFLRARGLVSDIDDAAEIASTMGFLGQMGALTANVVASIVVNR